MKMEEKKDPGNDGSPGQEALSFGCEDVDDTNQGSESL